jgi:hypothetical protein
MSNIFMSYSSRDRDFVRQLVKDLKLLGHRPWFDEETIQVGDSIPGAIQEGLSSADFLVVVLSKPAVESKWVEKEWQAKYWDEVNERRITVLPVVRDDCELPAMLKAKRNANFRESYAVGFYQLCQAIERPLQPSTRTPDKTLLNRLVNSSIETLCLATSLPASPSRLRLRVFIFRVEDQELVCRYFWSANQVSEQVGLTKFALADEVAKQVAVVRAALKRTTCRTAVRPLKQDAPGIVGDVEDELSFVLACPLFAPDNTVWGTVDFDTSTPEGEQLLRTDDAAQAIFRIAKHLEIILVNQLD